MTKVKNFMKQKASKAKAKLMRGGEEARDYEPEPIMSDCSGRKKALFVGINYEGSSAPLSGCRNDVLNISSFLFENYGFSERNSKILLDGEESPENLQPTKANIIKGLKWLVKGARPNDSLFFHYSGHGGSVADESGDEVDGMDECLCPVDYEENGVILDDDVHDLLIKPLPAGVRLTCIFDACHSATLVDVPYIYNVTGGREVTMSTDNVKDGIAFLKKSQAELAAGRTNQAIDAVRQGLKMLIKPPPPPSDAQEALALSEREKVARADVIVFSGCRDDQTSADAYIDEVGNTGALSHAFVKTLTEYPESTYTELLSRMRETLEEDYTQVPQMSSGRFLDMNTPFTV
ncbi:hypothetical protein H9P43_004482 [Blastocladiella emersonii ATCC 22665]|nr:hypothetical protein H9P43_004482 [Blastocladiella emersonii ATCC 22665]